MPSLRVRRLSRMFALGMLATVFFTPQSSLAQAVVSAGGPRDQEGQEPAVRGQMFRTATKAPKAEKPEMVPGAAGSASSSVVNIRVDNTGVSSWKYRNPRNPPLVWDRKEPAPERFRLQFINATSGATVKVTLPQVTVPFVAVASDGRPFNPPSLLRLDVAAGRREAHRLVNLSRDLADKAQAYVKDEPSQRITCLAQFLADAARFNDLALGLVVSPEAPALEEPAVAKKRAEDARETASDGRRLRKTFVARARPRRPWFSLLRRHCGASSAEFLTSRRRGRS